MQTAYALQCGLWAYALEHSDGTIVFFFGHQNSPLVAHTVYRHPYLSCDCGWCSEAGPCVHIDLAQTLSVKG